MLRTCNDVQRDKTRGSEGALAAHENGVCAEMTENGDSDLSHLSGELTPNTRISRYGNLDTT